MELRHLKYFIMVAKTLNFSEASRRLYVTQGTLSQQIQQLEAEIGARLFERTRQSVTLTEAGEELLPLAQQTVEDSEICSKRIKDLNGALTGTLHIGSTPSFSSLLTETIRNFTKEHPGVRLMIQSETASDLIEMVKEKKFDIALAFRPAVSHEELECEPLFANQLSAVMRRDHPLSSKSTLSLEDLESQRIVLPGKSMQSRRAFDIYLGLDTRKLSVSAEVNDPNLIMDIVEHTNLISVMSSLASFYRRNLVSIPLEGGRYSMQACIFRPRDGYRKRASDIFVEMLRESAQVERICRGL